LHVRLLLIHSAMENAVSKIECRQMISKDLGLPFQRKTWLSCVDDGVNPHSFLKLKKINLVTFFKRLLKFTITKD
jgi:hypothetical protein